MDELIDLISGKFEFIKPIKLSQGKSTSTYLVQDTETKKQYAAKIFKTKFSNEEEKNTFLNEVINYSKIKEPTILPLSFFNMYTQRDYQFPAILTEYLPKGSLDKMLEETYSGLIPAEFNITQRLIISIGIAISMRYLHANEVIHRNLRPSNIILDDSLCPHIANFFFSQYSDSNQTDDFLYTAPEVLQSQQETLKSDVYSFSLIFYELLTLKKPFENCFSCDQLIIEFLRNNKRPDLTVIPDDHIRGFLMRCWSNNPKERPTFNEIYEEITDERYCRVFKANYDEIDLYLEKLQIEEDPIACLKKFADLGNSVAMYNYAVLLEEGKGIQSNKTEAARYFKMSADQGNSEAMYRYAVSLINGKRGDAKMNKKEGFKYLKMSAKKGNNNAMFKCGIMLYTGDGVQLNKTESMKYFKMAADAGHANAMFNVGYMLENGDGVPIDKITASLYYKKSADNGNVEAMVNYAVLVENGDGVPVNKPEAAKYYKMAAENGNLEANLTYGYLCDVGDGIEVNKKEAIRCYKLGADKGNVRSMISYAYKLSEGDGIEMNKKEAARFFKMAADKGDAEGMIKYCFMAYQGQGIETNKRDAMKYAKMAADLGNQQAMFFYGVFLLTGEAGVVNKREAARYLKMSADQGNVHAIFRYGVMLSRGEGVKKNLVEAEKYFTMAKDMGYKFSEDENEEEEENGTH